MKANLRLPPGIVDRLAGESDRKRALRLRRHIITADKGGVRELPDETKELLAAVDDDASGDDERHDLRWCQHQSVWHVLEKRTYIIRTSRNCGPPRGRWPSPTRRRGTCGP